MVLTLASRCHLSTVSCMQIQYSILRHCSGVGVPQYLSQLQTSFLRIRTNGLATFSWDYAYQNDSEVAKSVDKARTVRSAPIGVYLITSPRATFKPQESEIYLCNLFSCRTIRFQRKQTDNVISWCE